MQGRPDLPRAEVRKGDGEDEMMNLFFSVYDFRLRKNDNLGEER